MPLTDIKAITYQIDKRMYSHLPANDGVGFRPISLIVTLEICGTTDDDNVKVVATVLATVSFGSESKKIYWAYFIKRALISV